MQSSFIGKWPGFPGAPKRGRTRAEFQFRRGDLCDPAAFIRRLKANRELLLHLNIPGYTLPEFLQEKLAQHDGSAYPPGEVQSALVSALNHALAHAQPSPPAPDEPARRARVLAALREAFALELGPPPSRRRRFQRLIVQVLQDLRRSEPTKPQHRDELLLRWLPHECEEWLPPGETAFAYDALEELGRAGAVGRLGMLEGTPGEYYELAPTELSELELERRLDLQPREPSPFSAGERTGLLLLLGIGVLFLWIFYSRFFPVEFKSEAAAFNTFLTGLAGFVGLRGVKSLGGWPSASFATLFRRFGWGLALSLVAVAGFLDLLGFASPCVIETVPGARITVDGQEQSPVLGLSDEKQWKVVKVPLWLSWGNHRIDVRRRFFTEPNTHTERQTTFVSWRVNPREDASTTGNESQGALPKLWRRLRSQLPSWQGEKRLSLGPTIYWKVEAPAQKSGSAKAPLEWQTAAKNILIDVSKSLPVVLPGEATITRGKGSNGLLIMAEPDENLFGLYELQDSKPQWIGSVDIVRAGTGEGHDTAVATLKGATLHILGLSEVSASDPGKNEVTGAASKDNSSIVRLATKEEIKQRIQHDLPKIPDASHDAREAAQAKATLDQVLDEVGQPLARKDREVKVNGRVQILRDISRIGTEENKPWLKEYVVDRLKPQPNAQTTVDAIPLQQARTLTDEVKWGKPRVYIQYGSETTQDLEKIRARLVELAYEVPPPQRIAAGGLPRTSDIRYRRGDKTSEAMATKIQAEVKQILAEREIKTNPRPYSNPRRFELWLSPDRKR